VKPPLGGLKSPKMFIGDKTVSRLDKEQMDVSEEVVYE